MAWDWDTSRPAVTAEWLCTRCGVSNRKRIEPGTTEINDRCVHCRLRHRVRIGDRPVYWHAEAA